MSGVTASHYLHLTATSVTKKHSNQEKKKRIFNIQLKHSQFTINYIQYAVMFTVQA